MEKPTNSFIALRSNSNRGLSEGQSAAFDIRNAIFRKMKSISQFPFLLVAVALFCTTSNMQSHASAEPICAPGGPIRTVNVSVSTSTASEEAATVVFITLMANGNVTVNESVTVAVTGTGITGGDYTCATSITIPAGTASGIISFTVVDDNVLEGLETATITISNPSIGIVLGATTSQIINIADNESRITLSASATSGTEAGATAITITAHASAAIVGNESIDLLVSGTNITAGDYTLSSTTFSFANGETSKQITFTVVNDNIDENVLETCSLYLSNPSTDLSIGAPSGVSIGITDNDETVSLNLSANAGSEAGQTVITVTATADDPVTGAQSVNIQVSGTGITTGDYTLGNTAITISNGQTSANTSFTVVDDAVAEGTETATVTFTNLSAGLVAGTLSDNIVITDNDVAVSISLLNFTASEAATTTIYVRAETNAPVAGNQTVEFTVAGTGITAGDYTTPGGTTITIPNGGTLGVKSIVIVDDLLPEGPETGTITLVNPSAGLIFGSPTSKNFTIADNDGNPVNLSVSANTGTENAATAITVTATTPSPVVGNQSVTVQVTGTGITTGDYALSSSTIQILNGATSGNVTFTVVDDAVLEGNETAILTISNPTAGILIGSTNSQNILIEDNERPSVALTVSANTGSEAATTAITLTATSAIPVSSNQTVSVNVSGTGITAGDYTLSASQITILTGTSSGQITFTVVDDALIEGTETAIVTISNPSTGVTIGAPSSANITITDNDVTSVNLSASTNSTSESGATVVTLTATTTAPVGGAQTVNVGVSGTGITAGDYILSASQISIANGATSGQITFTVVDDIIVEGTETAIVTISNPSAGMVLGATTTQNITILDNELVSLELSVSTNSASEAAATVVNVTVTASFAVTGSQTVDLVVTGDVNGGDYALGSSTLTIPNGSTTASTTFTVVDDTLMEPFETATISLANYSAGVSAGATTSQNIVIADNDLATVELSVSSNSGSESGATAIILTATSSIPVNGDQTVDVVVSGTGITAGDYTLSSTVITILGGASSGNVTFTIVDDAVGEGPETAIITLVNPSSNLVLGVNISENITIADNEPTAVNLSLSANKGSEYAQTVINVIVTSDLPVSGNQTIDLLVTGTGITGGDYSLSAPTVTILDAQSSGQATFTVEDDTLVEGIEIATISLANPSAGISVGTTSSKDITIYDDESASVVTFSLSNDTALEANSTVINLILTAQSPVYADQTVNLSVAGNFVTASDYTLSDTVIRILEGDTVGITTMTIVNDMIDEGTERAWIYISNATEGLIVTGDTAQILYILDDDLVDISEHTDLAGIAVYPNPVSDWLNIDLSSRNTEMVAIALLDVSGRVFVHQEVNLRQQDSKQKIDMRNIAIGTYILRVQNGDEVKAFRIIKN